MKDVKVSVVMITYNHEAFIEEALQGVLMQQCDFPLELIIANDHSTDQTHEVIEGLLKATTLPNHITIHNHYHSQNKGMMSNFIWALKQAKGNYIAICEGDDYWTDPLKLQKQVDLMEANENYAGCFHNAVIINSETNNETPFLKDDISQTTFKTKDLFEKWLVPTASFMFKNRWDNFVLTKSLPEWITSIGSGDLALILFVSLRGSIKRIEDNMCIYRRHSGGLTSDRAGDPIQFLILGHMYYNFNRETEGLFIDDIKKGFDVKLKAFYDQYFKSLYEKKQNKKVLYSKSKIYEQLGAKKIVSLMFYAINKKLFRR